MENERRIAKESAQNYQRESEDLPKSQREREREASVMEVRMKTAVYQ